MKKPAFPIWAVLLVLLLGVGIVGLNIMMGRTAASMEEHHD